MVSFNLDWPQKVQQLCTVTADIQKGLVDKLYLHVQTRMFKLSRSAIKFRINLNIMQDLAEMFSLSWGKVLVL